jgi:hypothetical protein
MRYIGKLENGKVFDSNTKGWDLGVAGMKVGGERKLRIPAALAYGKQKVRSSFPLSSPFVSSFLLPSRRRATLSLSPGHYANAETPTDSRNPCQLDPQLRCQACVFPASPGLPWPVSTLSAHH